MVKAKRQHSTASAVVAADDGAPVAKIAKNGTHTKSTHPKGNTHIFC